MNALSLDMHRAARSRQGSGRPHVLPDRSEFGRNSMMSHPAPATVTIPVDQLWSLQQDASALAIRAGNLLDACGIDMTQAVPTLISPAEGDNVFSLADYRARRQAVQR